jgi:hypothetical protein
MSKKDLIAHCTTMTKKLARNKLTIEDLRKKKSWPKEHCADCEAKNVQWNE